MGQKKESLSDSATCSDSELQKAIDLYVEGNKTEHEYFQPLIDYSKCVASRPLTKDDLKRRNKLYDERVKQGTMSKEERARYIIRGGITTEWMDYVADRKQLKRRGGRGEIKSFEPVPVYNVPLESITRYDMLPRIEIEKQPTLIAKGKTKYGQMAWGQNQTCEKRNATQEMKDFAEKLKTDYVESVKQKAIERVNNVKLKKCG